jgi:hypothetical protein
MKNIDDFVKENKSSSSKFKKIDTFVKAKDLEEGKKQADSYKKADKQFNPTIQDKSKPFLAPQKSAVSFNPANSSMMKTINQFVKDNPPAPTNSETRKDLPSRKIPVIGGVFKALDKLSDTKVQHVIADVGQSLYTPGAGLANVAKLTGAAENLVSRALPSVGRTVGGTIAKKAASEAIVGAPLGVAQSLAQGQDNGEAIKGGVYGALLGGATGALTPTVGKIVSKIANRSKSIVPEVEQALPHSAQSAQKQTIDDFVKTNQEVAATTQLAPDHIPSTASDTQAILGTRANYKNQLDNGNLSPELKRTLIPSQKVLGERATYRNMRDNGGLSVKLNATLERSNKNYNIATDAEAVAKANRNVENVDDATSKYMGNKTPEKEDITTAILLMKKLDALGDHEKSLNLHNKLMEDLTRGGQTSQAASLIGKLSPEGQLLNLLRHAKSNGKTVSLKDSIEFKAQAAKVQKNAGAGVRTNQFTEILDRMAKGEKIAPEEIQKMSDYLASAEKNSTKSAKVIDDLPREFKDVRKRDKIVSYLDDVEQAALARIAKRKNNLNSLPIGEWADHAIVVSSQIAKGSIKAATHVEDLVKLFGEEIRPVATQVFQKAQGMLKRVSPSVGEGDMNKANQAFRRLSGEAEAEKAVVVEMANHVKKLIADAKLGKLDPADIQKLRDYSDEIADMAKDAKPKEFPTQEQRFLQSVKSLSKKIAQVETEKMPIDQANREVSSLLRQITKISEEGSPLVAKQPLDSKALSDIAHDVMEKSRPNPKPTTLQEKIVEKYVKDNPKVSPKDIETLRNLAKNVTRLSGDARIDADIAMQKILNSYEKSSVWDKALALRYMSMLLNTSTQAINAASGPIMATTGHVADVFGTMLDITMSKALNKPRTTTLYGANPLEFIARYLKGLKVGAKAGAQGVNPAGIQSTNEIRGLAFKSLKNPFGLAERALGAVSKGPDFAAYSAVYKSEMEKQGFLSAINSGIKRSDKAAIKAHIENFINEPTEAAMLQADRIGKNTTFQRSDSTGGKVANHLNNAPTLVKPFVNAVVPFVRTPINMASSAVTMTPAGIIKGLFQLTSKSKASQREAIRTLSLGITGSGISAVGYYLFNLGIITGANDSGDKDVDAIREQAGKGKYRFNQSGLMRYLSAMLDGEGSDAAEKAAKYQEGDHAFDYNKLQPLAFPLAIGASLGQNKTKPIVGKLEAAGTDAYGSLFGMSTLKGVQTVFQPSYGGTQGEKAMGTFYRVEESFLKSFSWGGLAQEARRQDPIVRKTPFNDGPIANTKAYFKSRIPGMSESLPANKTTLGMDKMNAPGIMGQYVNPYKSEVAAYSNAAVLISDLIDSTGDTSLAPSAPEKKVEGKNRAGDQVSIAIPQDRYEQLQEELGHNIILKIAAINTSLTDAKKAEKIKEIYSKVRKTEMDKVKRELGIRVSN